MSVLNVTPRDGTKPHALRREGKVPMALIERGKDHLMIQADAAELRHALAHASGTGMFDLVIEGEKKPRNVIVKQVDHDAIKRAILNVTVMQIKMDDLITVDLPVVPVGTPPAVEEHVAILNHPTTHVTVRAKVSDLPDHIEVDVAGMEVNTTIMAGELKLAEGLELMSSPEATLFTCTPPPVVVLETPTEEEEGEPELLGEETEEGTTESAEASSTESE
ncbi:MAG: 50S ribosomal protein L25 [Fimbriimonadaceae bacterium]|nr:50S ribosomal protein L25 [Chthonomonadaceae bacterium]MCO5295664.1 50S ribosomal protein L25 [Fimbriimonadaceae bacterium]